MTVLTFGFSASLWLWQGKGAWHFITVPEDVSGEIRFLMQAGRTAWGSVPVTASIGETSWQTSVFPDSKRNAYLLPVKADIRKKEKIAAGDMVSVTLLITVDL